MNSEGNKPMRAKKRGQWINVLRRLMNNRLAVLGLSIVVIIVLAVVLAPWITSYDYDKVDYSVKFTYPCAEHIFGTDNLGRDLFTRMLYGGRVSLLVALIASLISLVGGGLIGAVSGFFGGRLDDVIMRVMEIIMSIPSMLMAVAVSAALGSGTFNTALAIAISGMPGSARIMRASVMTIREQEYVEAARACGSTNMRIILRQILPNTLSPLIVDTSLKIGLNIISISLLSFVGLGVQPPTPEWGAILSNGRTYIRDFWPMVIIPGSVIMLTLFGFNLLGDGLRDALDPKLKK